MPRYTAVLAAMSATVRAVKRVKGLPPTRAALNVTPAAVTRIRDLLKEKPDAIALKISVKQRGCNGLSYTLDYVSEKAKMDEEVALEGGLKILIDKKAQLTLLGTEMDFQESKLSSEFVFNNPNIKGTCGCGESFSM
ncbi:putative Iron-sulfur cluster assembly 1-like protein, mitochondrial [Hypsibius exemplaris]|uniref:Iron-sulfur cluster assembly 1 homolog, mitochondrial n=1 Tax=Hypsibius exemplaris TaxID=2072580 RepID=A0A1W0WAH9_HYPEX|nr:putative Iron-sulfur cluster assembly 1-like protein, mitochondrial [Hypsibius exemplaris]